MSEDSDTVSQTCAIPPSLENLYAASADTLVSRIRMRFGNGPPYPEDIVQSAFLKLLQKENLKSIRDLKAYLFTTANNLALSEMRALAVRERHTSEMAWLNVDSDEGSSLDLERVLTNEDALERLANVIRQLPARERRIFRMRRIDDMTISEIARTEGLSRTYVRKLLSHATEVVDAYITQHSL